MSSRDEVQVWAEMLVNDPIFSNPQRAAIEPDYWAKGWLREVPVAAQELNQLFYLITDILKNDTLSPALNLSDVDNVAAARTNLGIILTDYLRKDQNLADVPNKATARANLELNTTLFNEFFDKIYPVGTVYENKTNSANPNTYLGRGTWVAEGAGRVAVGAGSGTDINGTVQNFTAGTTGGEYSHELTVAELPAHDHPVNWQLTHETGLVSVGYIASGNGSTTGEPIFSDSTDNTGSNQKHNNVQPYSVYYRWLRTS